MNKKKIFAQMYKVLMILFFLFSALVFSAFAEVIYSDNFESGWGNWSVDNGIWQIGTPTAGPESCHSGSQCAGTNLNGKYDPNTDSRLITPSIYLPEITNAREEIHLRFWQWFSYASYDAGYVQISTYDQKTHKWSGWQTVSPAIGGGGYSGGSSTGWSLMDVDLTNYAGKKIRIAFFHTADSFGGEESTGWYIDDIEITGVGLNQLPIVDLFTSDFTLGNAPLTVHFTCNAHDPDGSITSYKWDFDGDGTFDQKTTIGTVTHTYTKAGVYNATVTVFDDKGASKKSNPLTIRVNLLKGDLNADGKVDLKDAIIALKVTAGLSVNQKIYPEAEPTGDGRIGPDDAIFILRKLAQE